MDWPDLKTMTLHPEGAVLTVVFDHPPLNLISLEMTFELKALAKALRASDTKVALFKSADPDFFLAHFDLHPIKAWPVGEPVTTPSLFAQIVDLFRALPVISIAQVDGIARGGGSEFLLALDMVFASPRARFNQLEAAIGIIPGGGGTARLPHRMGRNRALEVITSARDFSAGEASAYGWINRVLPAEELTPFVESLAQRIAGFPKETLAAAKRVVETALTDPGQALIDENGENTALIEADIPQRLIDIAFENGAQTREGELDIEAMINALKNA